MHSSLSPDTVTSPVFSIHDNTRPLLSMVWSMMGAGLSWAFAGSVVAAGALCRLVDKSAVEDMQTGLSSECALKCDTASLPGHSEMIDCH